MNIAIGAISRIVWGLSYREHLSIYRVEFNSCRSWMDSGTDGKYECRSGTAFSVNSHIRMYLHTNSVERSTPHHLQLSSSENVGYAQNGNFKGKLWSEFNPLGIVWFSSNFQTIPQWSRKAAGAKPTGQSAHLRQRLLEGRVRNPRAQETWEVAQGVTNLKTSNIMLFYDRRGYEIQYSGI